MSYIQCGHCGNYHSGYVCPKIKVIEYYPDGSIKRVEYFGAQTVEPQTVWSPGFHVGDAGHRQ